MRRPAGCSRLSFVSVLSFLSLALALGGGAPAAQAAIIEWDLVDATGQSVDVLLTAPNVTASAITTSSGITPWPNTTESGFVAASGWAPGAAADPTKYYEWSVTAAPGYVIDYDSITLALFRGIQGANHGADLWDLRASTDGFTSPSSLLLQTYDISGTPGDSQTTFVTDLSAIGSQSSTVTFRLFGYDYTSPGDYSGLGNDSGWLIYGTGVNPAIEGTVLPVTPIPEPSPGLLLLAGLAVYARACRTPGRGRRSAGRTGLPCPVPSVAR